MTPILADTAGAGAIVTAIGGVLVSLSTVYLNSRKQATDTGKNTGQIDALTEQIASLAIQLSALKSENSTLKLQIQLLEAENVKAFAAPEPEPESTKPVNKPVNKPKKKKK